MTTKAFNSLFADAQTLNNVALFGSFMVFAPRQTMDCKDTAPASADKCFGIYMNARATTLKDCGTGAPTGGGRSCTWPVMGPDDKQLGHLGISGTCIPAGGAIC